MTQRRYSGSLNGASFRREDPELSPAGSLAISALLIVLLGMTNIIDGDLGVVPRFCCRAARLAVLLALPSLPMEAQTPSRAAPPLVTDRPDQTESTAVVSPGSVQLEVGWTLAQSSEGSVRVRSHSVPQSLARIGIVRRLEARVGFAGWMRFAARAARVTSSSSGVGDLDVGFKYRVTAGEGLGPEVALLGTVTVPTGEDGFGGERVDPLVRIAFSSMLSERVSLGSNVGASWTSTAGAKGTETMVDFLYTLVLGLGISERVGAFAESFGTLALEGTGDSRHSLDGGFTFQVLDDLQLDVSGGIGINAAAEDWFVGVGLSVRVGE